MKKLFLLFLLPLSLLLSCTDLSDVEKRLDKVEEEVSDIKSAIAALQESYSSGKIITDVQPLQNLPGGWRFIFSDGSYIDLLNGADGNDGADCADVSSVIIPYLLVDSDGYWCVSYDNGATFSRIMDNSAAFIKSTQAEDGSEGLQIRVAINADGCYVYNLYRLSEPNTIVDTVVTQYMVDKHLLVISMTKDKVRNTFAITLADGTEFTFNKEDKLPASIAILTTQNLYLAKGGIYNFNRC